ncbi:hypothetical protein [Streptosporangium sp. H16]
MTIDSILRRIGHQGPVAADLEDGVARLWHKTGTQDDLWRARVSDTP